jgi:hypothetical protein
MRRFFRLLLLAGIAYAVWKRLAGRVPDETAVVSFADGSSVALESGSPDFERLAALARSALWS